MPEFQVEMHWRCSTCRVDNLGRYKVCQNCGKPKGDEAYYRSGTATPTLADAVTDPALLKQATAGEDWACSYCGSQQRRDSGECAECGAEQGQAERPAPLEPPVIPPNGRQPLSKGKRIGIGCGALFLLMFLGCCWAFRTRQVEAQVVERSWNHTVSVERYKIVDEEGFSKPSDAMNPSAQGQRVHHVDKVQDGTRRESYTASVACGETCSTSPVRCTSNKNGFESCSSGDQRCSTKYCSETRYRDVAVYKDVPRYAEWYAWRAWRWAHQRDITDQGASEPPTWASDERVALEKACGAGEKERATRVPSYRIVFEENNKKKAHHEWKPPTQPEFDELPLGSRRTIEVNGLDDKMRILTKP